MKFWGGGGKMYYRKLQEARWFSHVQGNQEGKEVVVSW